MLEATDVRTLHIDPQVAEALVCGTCGDPFAVLGPHAIGDDTVVRAFLPGAQGVDVAAGADHQELTPMRAVQVPGLFAARLRHPASYRFRIRWPTSVQETEDPYSFGLLLGDLDLHLISEGLHRDLWTCLGAQAVSVGGVAGIRFAVWAPNALRVSVVGDFNAWDGRRHLMRIRHGAGIWELFVPRLGPGERYKYEIVTKARKWLPLKADPVALETEAPPATASVIADGRPFSWTDAAWLANRAARQAVTAPLSIYEVHAGSWLRRADENDRVLTWDELAARLIPYIAELGFTHIELLPVMEHPFGGSWGYQPLGLFAPTRRHGPPEAFARFVNNCHEAGIGVILDWVPAHFPTDVHGLALFDGTALYEHQDPREGRHQDWDTLIYNFGRAEVQGFLIASALQWLERFHIDGLRVDAVASMLYRDYSRKAGEWVPNIHGGRENLEAIAFLKHLNGIVAAKCPGTIVVAEESTAWPGVTQRTELGGLGFSYKWNMGWMHDTLHYMANDPVHRSYHHHEMTFGLLYAFSENFVLPLSHDEVVHGKRSLLSKMPGDRWQRFANLRAYLALMWAHPGKKLLFMGGEIAQWREWDHDSQLDWQLLDDRDHRGVHTLVRDLNSTYLSTPALHREDCRSSGFCWIVGDDNHNSVFAFLRLAAETPPVLAVGNLTPVPRQVYRLGVPEGGRWREIINTDAGVYGGSNFGNRGAAFAEPIPSHGQPFSLELVLPPLATLYLSPDR